MSEAKTTDQAIKQLEKAIIDLAYQHSPGDIFSDFVAISSLAISNVVDGLHYEEREKEYLRIIGHYKLDEQQRFPELLALLVDALEERVEERRFFDVLGRVFHDLELHNKYKGQFFTPQELCDMMGAFAIDDNVDEIVQEKGYFSIHEPTCGSGAMVFGMINTVVGKGINHSEQLLVNAWDIDLKCVHITYLQLALYGVPAVVIQGNTLTLEEYSRWYTPAYMLNRWYWKKGQSCEDTEIFRRMDQPLYGFLRDWEQGNAAESGATEPTEINGGIAETNECRMAEYSMDSAGQLQLF